MRAIRFRTPEKWVFTLGAGLIVAAAIGGGLEVAGFEIPLVSSVPRQLVLGFFGVVVIVISFLASGKPEQLPSSPAKAEHEPPVQKARTRKLVTAMPSETVVNRRTEVWAQICRATSSGFLETLPQYTASGEEIRKDDARSHPATVHFPVESERLGSTSLQVSISAPDFLIEERQQQLILSPTHDSGLIVFVLTPHTTAWMSRVFVSVSQRQREQTVVVGSASLTTRIGAPESKPSAPWIVVEQSLHAEAMPYASGEKGAALSLGILIGKRTEEDPADPLGVGEAVGEHPVPEETHLEASTRPQPAPTVSPGASAPRSDAPRAFNRGRAAYLVFAAAVVGGLLIAWKVFL